LTILYYIIFTFLTLFAGTFQALGLIKGTIYSLGIGLILSFIFFFNLRKIDKKGVLYFLFFTLTICLSSVINETFIVLSILYFFTFCLVPLAIFSFVKNTLKKIDLCKLLNFMIIIGVIQLPIVLLQFVFKNQIASIAQISSYDVGFGTFPLANDHVMCFYLICLTNLLLWKNNLVSTKTKTALILWFGLTILVSNSKISLVVFLFTLIMFFLAKRPIKFSFYLLVSAPLFGIIIILFPEVVLVPFSNLLFLYDNVIGTEFLNNTIQQFVALNSATRPMMTYYLLVMNDFSYVGNGPYTYFNPILGRLNFPNHSQLLWFYLDLGILGIVSLILFIRTMYNGTIASFIICVAFIVYSYVAITIGDICFVFIFAAFHQFLKTFQNEYPEHSISSLEKN
jgi:hypothetical protein